MNIPVTPIIKHPTKNAVFCFSSWPYFVSGNFVLELGSKANRSLNGIKELQANNKFVLVIISNHFDHEILTYIGV